MWKRALTSVWEAPCAKTFVSSSGAAGLRPGAHYICLTKVSFRTRRTVISRDSTQMNSFSWLCAGLKPSS